MPEPAPPSAPSSASPPVPQRLASDDGGGTLSVICRSLHAGRVGPLEVLDVVSWPEGGQRQVRVFLASGTDPAIIAASGTGGTLLLREVRPVSGGVLIFGEAPPEGPLTLALSEGLADLSPFVTLPEWPTFRGRNTLFGQCIDEPAETVADWLLYHARNHDADAALIVCRTEGRKDALAAALTDLLAGTRLPMRVVLLNAPVPLGRDGLGPENHPFLAPDAPGKDRMEQPAPDPWRAPLGEHLIFEIAKWRFLAQARAVLSLDVSDILAMHDEAETVFDQCRSCESGVVMLVGRRVYPWRIRPGQRETFGDHICRPFDVSRGISRWGVAPDIAGLDKTWRILRISYARPDVTRAALFWRAMGIRVPGRRPSELAPKTALVADPGLLDLSERILGHKPVRPPVSATAAARTGHTAAAGPDAKTVIVTTMKNEGPFILEWLAYHRAIGVTGFLVYTNDCTDGTDTLLALLERKGHVVHRENPFRATNLPPQHAALQAAETEALVRLSDWAICMDVDEFINVKIGDGSLAALYGAMRATHPDANMIAMTWRLFGNSDVRTYADRFVTEQFTRAALEITRKPHQAWGFKTLFRNIAIYKKLGVHRPKGLRPDLWDQIQWLNGSGKPLPHSMFRNGWRSTATTYGYDWVQLNHYAVRSAESFLVKRDRGRVNHVDRDQGLNYWFRMNFNMVEDRSIQRMLPAARVEYDRLLADPEIRAAHEATVAAHRAKIVELRDRPDQAAFYAELTSERLERLSRMLNLFGSAVFSAGPGVIPPDLHLKPLPENFVFKVEGTADDNA